MTGKERTPILPRVDVAAVRDLVKRRRDARYDGTWLLNETIESMLIEVEAFRLHEDRAKKRRTDSARANKAKVPPQRLSPYNAERYDQP